MLGFLGRGRKQPKSEVFGQLTIERRVLITPRSTVSIPNIATISSGTITVPSKLVWMLALMLLVGGIGVFAYARARPGFVDAAAGSAMVLAALVLARFFSHKEKPCLFISSSDGHTSLFAGQQKTLEEVRRLLSDKINADDENAVYRINFEKGVVQTVNVAPGASVGAIVAGSCNHVMAGAGSARLGTADTFLQATNSPSAQLGNGHYSAGNSYHADYSQVLPNIAEMQRFYAGRPDTQDIADRLSELEHLMRSGTTTPASRSRLGQLLGDLSSVLGAYPGVVQIFQQAARIAGL
jgi:hypothetical protein